MKKIRFFFLVLIVGLITTFSFLGTDFSWKGRGYYVHQIKGMRFPITELVEEVQDFYSKELVSSDEILRGKVFDCFPFCHELELLKLRIHELKDVVDYFVLVESIEGQRGNEKPLYFEENKSIFAAYLDRIIHVAIREKHPKMGLWQREHFQRDQIIEGLKEKAMPNDLILISDVDEIPKRENIAQIREKLSQKAKGVRLHQEMFYYKFNLRMPSKKTIGGEDWFGTVATTYQRLSKHSPQYYRDRRAFSTWPSIWDGGWHFSSVGPNDSIRFKLLNVVEGGAAPSDEALTALFQTLLRVSVDDSFPEYLQENQNRLKEEGFFF